MNVKYILVLFIAALMSMPVVPASARGQRHGPQRGQNDSRRGRHWGGVARSGHHNRHHNKRYHHGYRRHKNYNYRHRRYRPTVRIYGHLSWPTVYSSYRHYREPIYITEPIPQIIVNRVKLNRREVVESTSLLGSQQERLTHTLLRGTRTERRLAAEDLGQFDNIAAVAALIDALFNDAVDNVRAAAATSLGETGDVRAYDALMRCSALEAEADVQAAAVAAAEQIESLAETDELYVSRPPIQSHSDYEKLLGYLEDLRYGSADRRDRAAEKLARFGHTQATAALINTLVNDRDKDVRKEAAESLGKIADRMALPFLNTARFNDSSKSVQKKARQAIERIRETIQ